MYRTRSEVSWQLFSDSLVITKYDNEFKVCFFIMQNMRFYRFKLNVLPQLDFFLIKESQFWIEILPNVRIRHFDNMPMITLKRKDWSNRMSPHVTRWTINISLSAIHTECTFVLTNIRRGQWNRSNMQEDFNLSAVFLECCFMHETWAQQSNTSMFTQKKLWKSSAIE